MVLGDENAQMTPENQKAVIYGVIKKDKADGLNPAQIAAKWNSGSEVGWENKRGVNSAGVAYDVPKYVASVTSAYQKVKGGSQVGVDPNNPSSTGYQPPIEPEAPEEPFSFKKMLAEAAVEKIEKVKGIANEILVDVSTAYKINDADIVQAALNSLNWAFLVPDDKIKVAVDNGRLTLAGEVEYNYQKEYAEQEVENLSGVTFVINDIKVKPRVSPERIKCLNL
jgi:hypothetical protein